MLVCPYISFVHSCTCARRYPGQPENFRAKSRGTQLPRELVSKAVVSTGIRTVPPAQKDVDGSVEVNAPPPCPYLSRVLACQVDVEKLSEYPCSLISPQHLHITENPRARKAAQSIRKRCIYRPLIYMVIMMASQLFEFT